MSNPQLTILGGSEEIGANSCYLYFDGAGIIIDAGLHPKSRDEGAFPLFQEIADKPVDLLLITHAHTDHIGAIPYLLKYHPYAQIWMSEASRSISGLMLQDTTKILKSEVAKKFSAEMLSLYKPEVLERIDALIKGLKFNKKYEFAGMAGLEPLKISFYPSGHILGASSIMIEYKGKCLLHTGDINFTGQALIAGAKLPGHHIDALISESTNASSPPFDYSEEKKKLARFINDIVDKNGSVLMPSFALGKTQEVLKIVHSMMQSGKIPYLPIYTAGLSGKISNIYDKYCYYDGMKEPGFEVSDIPQNYIEYDRLFSGKYFREPSLVVVSGGMMHRGTLSYRLAGHWLKLANFGIAFTGYQSDDSPGYAILNSPPDEFFSVIGKKSKRSCDVASFRFSSHALPGDILKYVGETSPNKIFFIHGETESCENLAAQSQEILPNSKIFIPRLRKIYDIF